MFRQSYLMQLNICHDRLVDIKPRATDMANKMGWQMETRVR